MNAKFEVRLKSLSKKFNDVQAISAKREIDALLSFGVDSVERLMSIVRDNSLSADIRMAACWALGQLRAKRSANALLAAFDDKDHRVSWEAAKSLGLIGSKRVIAPLIRALSQNRSSEKRAAAAYALGVLCDTRATQPLIQTLLNENERPKVRAHAAEAIGYLRDNSAVAPLITALKSRSPELRFWSVFALGEIGDRRALPYLSRLARTDKAVLRKWGSVGNEASEAIKHITAATHQT